MGPTLFIWLATSSLLVLFLTSIAATILPDMLWHDLEEYCDKKRSFGTIQYDSRTSRARGSGGPSAPSAELGDLPDFEPGPGYWVLARKRSSIPGPFLGDVVGVTVVLMVSMVWLPWAIAEHFGPAFIYYTWPLWSSVATIFYPVTFGVDLLGGPDEASCRHQGRTERRGRRV